MEAERQLVSSEDGAKALTTQIGLLNDQHTGLESSLASLQAQPDQARADDLAEREQQLRKGIERHDSPLSSYEHELLGLQRSGRLIRCTADPKGCQLHGGPSVLQLLDPLT